MSLNTAYYFKGKLETNRKKIVKNYLRNWMFSDVLTETVLIYMLNLDENSTEFESTIGFYLEFTILTKFKNLHYTM